MVWIIFWFFLTPEELSDKPTFQSTAPVKQWIITLPSIHQQCLVFCSTHTQQQCVWTQSTPSRLFFYVAGEAFLTNKVIFSLPFWNFIIHCVTFIKMEDLECVKEEIPKVLVHVDSQDAPVEAVDGTAPIHDLEIRDISVTSVLQLCLLEQKIQFKKITERSKLLFAFAVVVV